MRHAGALALGCFGLLLVGRAAVAQVEISARVDRQEVTTDEQVELVVSVSGQGLSGISPSLPALADFAIASSSTSHSVQIVNGRMSTSVEYHYWLQPKKTGTLTIGPVTVESGGRTYKTDPITVKVTQGTGRAPGRPSIPPLPSPFDQEPPPEAEAGEDVFVRAQVDRQRVYVNQQVTYTFSLYRAINLWEAPRYEEPSVEGFWREELPEVEPSEETIRGRRYVHERIRMALFPTSPGKKTIGPAKLSYRAGFFGGRRTVATEPVSVEVVPLPKAGRPEGFEGAVGSWKAELTVKPRQVAVGDAVTAVVTITGEGNVETVGRPELSLPASLKQYEPSVERTTAREGVTVRGTVTFEHLLVPGQPGSLMIGPARLAYFDPEAGRYRTTETAAVPVAVRPRGASAGTGGAASAVGAAPTADIRDIKSAPASSAARLGAGFLALQVVPLALVVGAALYGRHQRRLLADPSYARAATALGRARGRLRAARRHRAAGDQKAFYRGLHEAVAGYVADRLDLPQAGLGAEAARQRLAEAGVREEVGQQIAECLRACDMGRFGNAAAEGTDMDRALSLAEGALKALARERMTRD
ncbi:MAG: BatD family protein [Armatimonadota bacterium]